MAKDSEDLTRQVNVRLTEQELRDFSIAAATTGESKQEVIRRCVKAFIAQHKQ